MRSAMSLIAALMFMQSMAQANGLPDLPNPADIDAPVVKPQERKTPVTSSCDRSGNSDSYVKNKLDDLTLWLSRLDEAQRGSPLEAFVAKEVEKHISNTMTLVKSQKDRMSVNYVKNLFQFYSVKYQNSASGSRAEVVYAKLRDIFKSLQSEVLDADLNCNINSLKNQNLSSAELIRITLAQIQKYNDAPAGSLDEKVAAQMANAAKDKIIPAFMEELSKNTNFRSLEMEAAKYAMLYQREPSRGYLEDTYRIMSKLAQERALLILRQNVSSMNIEQKYSLMKEYDNRYRVSPSSSAEESYAREVLAILSR